MALINKYSKLSDVILEDPSVITILNRFNIFLGVGDKTVEQVCTEFCHQRKEICQCLIDQRVDK